MNYNDLVLNGIEFVWIPSEERRHRYVLLRGTVPKRQHVLTPVASAVDPCHLRGKGVHLPVQGRPVYTLGHPI